MRFNEAWVAETDLFAVNTEDGPATACKFFVEVRDAAGRFFAHTHRFDWRSDAEALLRRVEAAGDINLTHWDRVRDRLPLEQELAPFGPAWEFEQDQRRQGN